jgi:Zn-dependent M28 family amino/carboxypeptidase
VLFLAVTAEERGLIGSKYFSRAPTVPSDQIKAVINIDGVMAFYHFESIIGYGAESSTLREPLLRALNQMELSLMSDPHPEISIFTQSDHYSFVLRGVPAIFLQMGEGPAPDGSSGVALSATRLHEPNDDLTSPIDYDEFARFTELYWRFVLETADMTSPPRWYEGDFFGDTFAPDAEKAPSGAAKSQ